MAEGTGREASGSVKLAIFVGVTLNDALPVTCEPPTIPIPDAVTLAAPLNWTD